MLSEETRGATELERLYDSLARWQWYLRPRHAVWTGEGLEMHKRLLPPIDDSLPSPGTAGLNKWLARHLDRSSEGRVLDVGCGFGATLFALARQAPNTTLVGIGASSFQLRMARREAQRQGLSERCTFRLQRFGEPIEGTYDLIVTIEALLHAPDLTGTVAGLARALAPDGRLTLVEDMAVDAAVQDEPAGRALARLWSTPSLPTEADHLAALAGTGLEVVEDVDLTPQVPRRPVAELTRRERRLSTLRRFMPWPHGRRVLDAFLGGIALERLYLDGRMRYRALVARRRADA